MQPNVALKNTQCKTTQSSYKNKEVERCIKKKTNQKKAGMPILILGKMVFLVFCPGNTCIYAPGDM